MLMEVSTKLTGNYKQRRYHDCRHIGAVWENYTNLTGKFDDMAFMLACAYHDVIYNPLAPKRENEFRSSIFFSISAMNSGISEDIIEDAAMMILATSDHWSTTRERDILFCDMDLAGLAGSWEEFCESTDLLRLEYSDMEPEIFETGRLNFLKSVLERDLIFRSTQTPLSWEFKARENISRMLEKGR